MSDIFSLQVHHLKSTQPAFYNGILNLLSALYDRGSVRELTENLGFSYSNLSTYLANEKHVANVQLLTQSPHRSQPMDVEMFLGAINKSLDKHCNHEIQGRICFFRRHPQRISVILDPNFTPDPALAEKTNGPMSSVGRRSPLSQEARMASLAQLPPVPSPPPQQQQQEHEQLTPSPRRSDGDTQDQGSQQESDMTPSPPLPPNNVSRYFHRNAWAVIEDMNPTTRQQQQQQQQQQQRQQRKQKRRYSSSEDEEWTEESESSSTTAAATRNTSGTQAPATTSAPLRVPIPNPTYEYRTLIQQQHQQRQNQQQDRHQFETRDQQSFASPPAAALSSACSSASSAASSSPTDPSAGSARKYVPMPAEKRVEVTQTMMEVQNYRCNMCQSILQCEEYEDADHFSTLGKTYELDHIERKELGRGDVHRLENLQVICWLCHMQKTRMENRYVRDYLNSPLSNSIDNCIFCKKTMPHALVIRHMVQNCTHAKKVLAASRLGVQFGLGVVEDDDLLSSVHEDTMDIGEDLSEVDEEEEDEEDDHHEDEEEQQHEEVDNAALRQRRRDSLRSRSPPTRRTHPVQEQPRLQQHQRQQQQHKQQQRSERRQQEQRQQQRPKKKARVEEPTRSTPSRPSFQDYLTKQSVFKKWVHHTLCTSNGRRGCISGKSTAMDLWDNFKTYCSIRNIKSNGNLSSQTFYRYVDHAFNVKTLYRTTVRLNLVNIPVLQKMIHDKYFKEYPFKEVFP